MSNKLWITITTIVLTLTLAACQTPSKILFLNQNNEGQTFILLADIPDSDGDGVPDNIDECPGTPNYTVVNAKGCPVIIEGGEALEMSFVGSFPPNSSQLPAIYDPEFEKIAEKLNESPEANIFVFGHTASNELNNNSLTTVAFNSLSRNRALSVKNTLILKYNIASTRIHTYDCSNKVLATDKYFIDHKVNDIDFKQRRVTLMASSEVHNLDNLKYASYEEMYGEYVKHCKLFE